MEAVAAHTMILVQHIRHGIAVSMLGHGLVESGVEHANLRQLGEQVDSSMDAAQVGRVVQRRQLNVGFDAGQGFIGEQRSEEHTSELQSLMRISYAVFCLKKNINQYASK